MNILIFLVLLWVITNSSLAVRYIDHVGEELLRAKQPSWTLKFTWMVFNMVVFINVLLGVFLAFRLME